MVKNPSASAEDARDLALIPGKEMTTSILAWEVPWTEEPGRLQSMVSQRWASTGLSMRMTKNLVTSAECMQKSE